MTTDKARKRAVRTRMHKTGERYAAARRHVVSTGSPAEPGPEPDPGPIDGALARPTPLPPRVAEPGTSDEALRNATGADWDTWLRRLDEWGAKTHSHTEIARHVASAWEIPGWWAQNVTVGYERARGMRAVHETTRGFEVGVSKTLAAPVSRVWSAIVEPAEQAAWLEPGTLEPLSSRDGRWARFAIAGTPSVIVLHLDPKGEDRTTVTASVQKLGDAEEVERQRSIWRERLAALATAIGAPSGVAAGRRRAS